MNQRNHLQTHTQATKLRTQQIHPTSRSYTVASTLPTEKEKNGCLRIAQAPTPSISHKNRAEWARTREINNKRESLRYPQRGRRKGERRNIATWHSCKLTRHTHPFAPHPTFPPKEEAGMMEHAMDHMSNSAARTHAVSSRPRVHPTPTLPHPHQGMGALTPVAIECKQRKKKKKKKRFFYYRTSGPTWWIGSGE